jgi:hypothetical protein
MVCLKSSETATTQEVATEGVFTMFTSVDNSWGWPHVIQVSKKWPLFELTLAIILCYKILVFPLYACWKSFLASIRNVQVFPGLFYAWNNSWKPVQICTKLEICELLLSLFRRSEFGYSLNNCQTFYVNITITIVDIIHRLVFYLKLSTTL